MRVSGLGDDGGCHARCHTQVMHPSVRPEGRDGEHDKGEQGEDKRCVNPALPDGPRRNRRELPLGSAGSPPPSEHNDVTRRVQNQGRKNRVGGPLRDLRDSKVSTVESIASPVLPL